MFGINAIVRGFGVGAGLIMAIGAQNAFVLRQGISGNNLFVTALMCSLIDTTLIILGIKGTSMVGQLSPAFIIFIKRGSIVFLTGYGLLSLKDCLYQHSQSLEPSRNSKKSLLATIGVILALSLLNPHVYLDTMVLLGSIGNQLPKAEQSFFASGASLASFVWFFSLVYGAKALAPILSKPKVWKIINMIVAIMMFYIAYSLYQGKAI